jgi:thiamine biosynthesis lipoprotein
MMTGMTRFARYWRRAVAVPVALLVAACSSPLPALRTVAGVAQGTTYSLQWAGGDTEPAVAAAAANELARIDALLSNYRTDSTLEQFNASASVDLVELPIELLDLFMLAKHVHEASNGCFDPTVRPLVRAWGFDTDHPAVPSAAALDEARAAVGLDGLELDDTHARKADPRLALDMASIGQGYSAERLAAVLEEHGSEAYLAEIGGEIVARGLKPDGTQWRIGVERPSSADPTPGPTLRIPAGGRTAVITSGAYRHFFDAEGRRYGHVIDARTGWPIDHSLLAVTVVGPDASTTAAWATALLCLGPEDATAVAEREQLAALLWIGNDDGSATLEHSPTFESNWRALLEDPAPR